MAPNLLRRGEVNGQDTLSTILRSAFPLGVVCTHCLHRALVDPKPLAERYGGGVPISRLKFRCRKCRRRSVSVETFWSTGSVKRFLRPD